MPRPVFESILLIISTRHKSKSEFALLSNDERRSLNVLETSFTK